MASIKPSKRSYSDNDSDSDSTNASFPRFVILESTKEKQLAKINPFVVEKVISGIVKPVSVKNR